MAIYLVHKYISKVKYNTVMHNIRNNYSYTHVLLHNKQLHLHNFFSKNLICIDLPVYIIYIVNNRRLQRIVTRMNIAILMKPSRTGKSKLSAYRHCGLDMYKDWKYT